MKRRTFVKNSTVLSLTSLYSFESIWHKYLPEEESFKIGLQLYTVRNEMAKNPKSTLKILAEMGYSDLTWNVPDIRKESFMGLQKKSLRPYWMILD